MPDPVPYQAYKSKRHSHTRSSSNTHLIPNTSPPSPTPRPFSAPRSPSPPPQVRYTALDKEKDPVHAPLFLNVSPSVEASPPPPQPVIIVESEHEPISLLLAPREFSSSPSTVAQQDSILSGAETGSSTPPMISTSLSPVASSSSSEPPSSPRKDESVSLPQPPRKASTFRRVPLRNPRPPLPSSPLGLSHGTPGHSRTHSLASTNGRQLDVNFSSPSRQPAPTDPRGRHLSTSSTVSLPTTHMRITPHSEPPTIEPPARIDVIVKPAPQITTPAPSITPSASTGSNNSTTHRPPAISNPQPQRVRTPYHPGFQPRGVVRSQTDNFLTLRRVKRDGEEEDGVRPGMKRVERTKLERRLEKLINLHFPVETRKETGVGRRRPGVGVVGGDDNRRASSFFDFDIRNMSIPDAGGLLRGVLGAGEANDVRAAEQRITPWQEDASVSKCPLCAAAFHPLTTRKHHCRLCGQIICSLPPKRPHRPNTCSLLFVVDSKTRMIEEVGEGVDYGVKRRRVGNTDEGGMGLPTGNDKLVAEEEKFLKGVRICRSCRPVLLRQQYLQEITHVPTFTKLYEMFVRLEQEIEESLPQFQELLLTLSHDDQPTKEASATRKRLLQAFAQYDELAKRIRRLPCPNGVGSSHDRVQMAVMTRASLFLQKNMFPLQSLPTPKRSTPAPMSNTGVNGTNADHLIDPDSQLALALQPLLEQEALLESFVEEAEARRKFEDVKTLKANLGEIRAEIKKIITNSEGGMRVGPGETG